MRLRTTLVRGGPRDTDPCVSGTLVEACETGDEDAVSRLAPQCRRYLESGVWGPEVRLYTAKGLAFFNRLASRQTCADGCVGRYVLAPGVSVHARAYC